MQNFLKKALFLLFVSPLLFLFSCSKDSSTNPSDQNNQTYFPTTVGSYWKYVEYELDSLGVKVAGTEDTTITTVVANQVVQGKNAAIMVSTSQSGGSTDTTVAAYENGKVYTLISLFANELLPVNVDQWIVIADFNNSEWAILKDTTFASFDVPDLGTVTPTVGIKGKKGNKTDLVVKNKVISSQEFIITFSYSLKIQIPNVPMPVTTKFDVLMHIWLGQGIGVAKTRFDPYKINILIYEQNFNGNESVLIDYKIK
jgi:hypothetical protein